MQSWISAAEAAIDGRADQGAIEVELVERKAPPLLDPSGVRALVAPVFAAFLWAATVLREMLAGSPLDAITLLLRLLALALSLRALLSLRELWLRLRVSLARKRYALALTDEGLFYRSPSGDVVVPRAQILEVREHGDWRGRSGRRWADVYVITRPQSGRTHLALPPIFLETSGVLAERLMRWLSSTASTGAEASAATPWHDSEPLASKFWERMVAGERPAGVTVIRHGSSWLQRGPYASILLGVAVLDGYLRLPAAARAAIGFTAPLALIVTLVVVPLVWVLLTRREIAPRGGLALVLTPLEAMMRTRSGVHRFRWASLSRITLEAKSAWSLLQGSHQERTLVLQRSNDSDVRYAEAFLGAPVEVVLALCEAYRRGSIAGAGPAAPGGESSSSASTPAS